MGTSRPRSRNARATFGRVLSLALPITLMSYACSSGTNGSSGSAGSGGTGEGGTGVDASVPPTPDAGTTNAAGTANTSGGAAAAGAAGVNGGAGASSGGGAGASGAGGGGPTAPTGSTLLMGDPASPALTSITDLMPVPAASADVVGDTIMTKLDVWLADSATVAQVNAALEGIGAKIVAMKAGSRAVTVAFARAADEATLAQKQQQIESFPGVLLADLARTQSPQVMPLPPAQDNVQDLFASRFPAAWNVERLAHQDCTTNNVNVVVLDLFGTNVPSTFQDEVPNFHVPAPAGQDNHGWKVASVALAAFNDGLSGDGVVTGAMPFPECVNARGVQTANLSGSEIKTSLALALPPGKVVVNVSVAPKTPTCTSDPCAISDFLTARNWLPAGIENAANWRELAANRDDDVLIVTAAGNDRNQDGGIRYPLLRNARFHNDFALGASSLIWGQPRLSIFQDATRFDPDKAYSEFPSLLPSADRQKKLTDYLDGLPSTVTLANNVLIVGASNNVPTPPAVEMPFSNSDPDVFAVGQAVTVAPDASGNKAEGTSVAAPQVAGLASYLLILSADLRALPMSVVKQAIFDNIYTDSEEPNVFLIDAYASVLSLDASTIPTPISAPVRAALLDVNSDGVFDQADVESFASALIDNQTEPPFQTWDARDLNGDGYVGGSRTSRFDLDRLGSTRFGTTSYSPVVIQNIMGDAVSFNEEALTDREILCYYAYSSLYVGDTTARDQRIGAACGGVDAGEGGGSGGGPGGGSGGGSGGGPATGCFPDGTFFCTENSQCCPGAICGYDGEYANGDYPVCYRVGPPG